MSLTLRTFWKTLLLLLVLFAAYSPVHASHLVGGTITYEYVGQVGNDHIYTLRLKIYRDCNSSTTPFDGVIQVGLYENVGSKPLIRIKNMALDRESAVNPPSGGSNCSFQPQVCLREGIYEDTILVPSSTNGYYLTHIRCCRKVLENLPQMGQTYMAFIPPTSLQNSSPTFNGVPAPYICENDQIDLVNTATDVDGDSLVYELAWPFDGGNANNPAPQPGRFMDFPVPLVSYKTNFSLQSPFGAGGVSRIDSLTGLTTVKAPAQGLYALAIAVKEYRNGTLISTTYRDVQIIVITCPPNPIPRLVMNTKTVYDIYPGDSLEFNITVSDSDSVSLTRTGGIFDGSTIDPPLPTLPEVQGKDSVQSLFSWNTACHHGSRNYTFFVKAQDNGCPGKTLNLNYSIRMIPFIPPNAIQGPDTLCFSSQQVQYSVAGDTANEYRWAVQGGTLLSGQSTQAIEVNWPDSGAGTVACYTIAPNNCDTDTVLLPVTILPRPVADAGPDVSFCTGETVTIGPANAGTGWSYRWLTTDGISNVNNSNPSLSLQNGTQQNEEMYYHLRVSNGWCAEFDSALVTVHPKPLEPPVSGEDTPCQHGTYPYTVPNTAGSSYQWELAGGMVITGQGTAAPTIRWDSVGASELRVVEINQYGCSGDTATFPVHITRPQIERVRGTDVICPNSRMIRYWVDSMAGSNYEWFITRGQLATGGNNGSVHVNWGDSGLGRVQVVETTVYGCISDTFSMPVLISYRLETPPILGDSTPCEHSNYTYRVFETNGSVYTWSISGGSIVSGQGMASLQVLWDEEGPGELTVVETSFDSVNGLPCTGDPVVLPIVIKPLPETTTIDGPAALCAGNEASYGVTGFSGSTFTWSISDGQVFTGQDSSTISTTWNDPGTFQVQVVEMTVDSCFGDTQEFTVTVHKLPPMSAIEGPELLCSTGSLSSGYRVDGLPGSTFGWSVSNGTIQSGQGSDSIQVAWNEHGPGMVKVKETTTFGCELDTLTKAVTIDGLQLQIRYVSTSEPDDSILHVAWETSNDDYLNQPITLTRTTTGSDWMERQVLGTNARFFADSAVETATETYSYRVATTNLCSAQVQARPHRSILLQNEREGDSGLDLWWNGYHGWEAGVREYEIYRLLNEERELSFYRSAGQDTALALNVGIDGYRQCYRIRAIENAPEPEVSWSNLTCAEFDAIVHIPTGFSPNTDGHNDTFRVVASNWRTLEMKVYNRWGELVHQSEGTGHGWRGYHNDQPAPAGTYVYVIRIRDNSSFTEYKGSVTLIR